jgi:hypothetical protein
MASARVVTARTWAVAASSATPGLTYGAARSADALVLSVHPPGGEMPTVSDLFPATAFRVVICLWLNLRAARTSVTRLQRAQIVLDTQLSLVVHA